MTAILLLTALTAPNLDAVVKIGKSEGEFNCSATIVSPDGLIVSAEHCGCEEMTYVELRNGTTAKVESLFEPEKNDRDQAAVLRIVDNAGPWPFIPLAKQAPPIGAKVRMLGYPGGEWYDSTATIVAGTARRIWLDGFDKRAGPGLSGGPLLNEAGELVGACSGAGGSDEVASVQVIDDQADAAAYVAWQEIKDAVDAAQKYERRDFYKARPVVVFTARGCGPCMALERDIDAGHFAAFDLVVHKYDPAAGWESEAGRLDYQKFRQSIKGEPRGFPIVWVYGTAEYRDGYAPQRRGGLVGFLQGIIEGLVKVVAGEQKGPAPPMPDGSAAVEPPKVEVVPGVAAPKGYEDLVASMAEARAELETLKKGNLMEKLKALAALKADVANIQTEAAKAKQKAKEDPKSLLWGLLGIVSGLVHRRVAA